MLSRREFGLKSFVTDVPVEWIPAGDPF